MSPLPSRPGLKVPKIGLKSKPQPLAGNMGCCWLPGGAVLALVLGVLLTVLSHCLVWAWVSDEKALQHVHNLELFIREITEIMFPKRHHVAVVDPFEKKVAEYPERLMKIIGNDPVHSGA